VRGRGPRWPGARGGGGGGGAGDRPRGVVLLGVRRGAGSTRRGGWRRSAPSCASRPTPRATSTAAGRGGRSRPRPSRSFTVYGTAAKGASVLHEAAPAARPRAVQGVLRPPAGAGPAGGDRRLRAMMEVELVNDGPVTLIVRAREGGARSCGGCPGGVSCWPPRRRGGASCCGRRGCAPVAWTPAWRRRRAGPSRPRGAAAGRGQGSCGGGATSGSVVRGRRHVVAVAGETRQAARTAATRGACCALCPGGPPVVTGVGGGARLRREPRGDDEVRFRHLRPGEIFGVRACGRTDDKAGAYAVQARGLLVSGSWGLSNVVRLPLGPYASCSAGPAKGRGRGPG